jgi:uncharacterized protein YxjI
LGSLNKCLGIWSHVPVSEENYFKRREITSHALQVIQQRLVGNYWKYIYMITKDENIKKKLKDRWNDKLLKTHTYKWRVRCSNSDHGVRPNNLSVGLGFMEKKI